MQCVRWLCYRTKISEKSQTYVVAEIGINHGGDLDKAIKLIDEAKNAGANAVKMQSYLTEKRVAVDSPLFKILNDFKDNI